MTVQTRRRSESGVGYHPWVAAIIAGLVGGAGMGVVLSAGTNLLPLIGALYGVQSFFWGWVVHLFNSVVFALLFTVVVSRPLVRHESLSLATYVGLGIVYGAFLGVLSGGVLFPLWLGAGGEASLAVPFLPLPGYVSSFVSAGFFGFAHLVYGALLGTLYPILSGSVPILGR